MDIKPDSHKGLNLHLRNQYEVKALHALVNIGLEFYESRGDKYIAKMGQELMTLLEGTYNDG